MSALIEALAGARVYDLAQPLRTGIPSSPNHPGFRMTLIRRHGDMVREDGGSAANELIVMGGHVGTHVDALAHVSQDGRLHGDVDVADAMAGGVHDPRHRHARAVRLPGRAARRGRLARRDQLEPATPIGPSELADAAAWAEVEPRPGDALLVRTGWATHWERPGGLREPRRGRARPHRRGVALARVTGRALVGSDTTAFEHIGAGMGHSLLPVHRVLLVENGIPIVEMLDLERLAADRVYRFAFVLAPLNIDGGTGSPVRPLALVDG